MAGLARSRAMSRTTLRRATLRDLSSIEAWYEEAERAVCGGVPSGGPRLEERFAGGNLRVIQRDRPIGLLEGLVDRPAKGWVTLAWVALEAGQRGWGYGSEAVREFEAKHAHARFRALIAPRNGLALYFWLRLGYRPARTEDVFWQAPGRGGIIAMIRG